MSSGIAPKVRFGSRQGLCSLIILLMASGMLLYAEGKTESPTQENELGTTAVPLRYWSEINNNVFANFKNLGDTPFAKELEKRTGIKVEYIHPVKGQEIDSFNLMIASQDLPDIVQYRWIPRFNGGPEKAIADGIILKLNDVYAKYAPNLTDFIKTHPELDRDFKTDSGSYYCFPIIRGDPLLYVAYGPMVRLDWLKELGLPLPTTVDDWYSMLTAFKDKKGCTAPLSFYALGLDIKVPFENGFVIGAYSCVRYGFYVDNGKVKYGPFEGGYRDFLSTMNKWYREGLLDKNFSNTDTKALDARVVNGMTGAITGWAGGDMGKYIPRLKEQNPSADFGPAPYPASRKGERSRFGHTNVAVANTDVSAITGKCRNVGIAAKWLDYGYSPEGGLLYNFGIAGESYNMDNNYPRMTELVLKNPDKIPVGQAWAKYARAIYNGAFVQRKEYIEQYYAYPQQKEALKLWVDTDANRHLVPPAVTPTPEEATQYARIMSDVDTYVDEYYFKTIMGTESLDDFGKYIEQLKKLQVEKAVSIQQAALDRYYKR